jgi:hypothetical protein
MWSRRRRRSQAQGHGRRHQSKTCQSKSKLENSRHWRWAGERARRLVQLSRGVGGRCARRHPWTTHRQLEHPRNWPGEQGGFSSRPAKSARSANTAQDSVHRRQRGHSNNKVQQESVKDIRAEPESRPTPKPAREAAPTPKKGKRSPTDRPKATSASAPTVQPNPAQLSPTRDSLTTFVTVKVNTRHPTEEKPLQTQESMRNPTDRPKATSASAPTMQPNSVQSSPIRDSLATFATVVCRGKTARGCK